MATKRNPSIDLGDESFLCGDASELQHWLDSDENITRDGAPGTEIGRYERQEIVAARRG